MKTKMLTRPTPVRVNRSELRDKQKAMLKRAKGSTVLVIPGNEEGDEKLVLDKKYFDEVLKRLRAAVETVDIAMDKQLFIQILAAGETLDEDMRLGKLHSMDEVFD
jgi:hypothetical protein